MSTWICDPRHLLVAALLALAGCLSFGPTAPRTIEVADSRITVAGPRGYCVDTAGTHDGESAAVVTLGSCAALRQSAQEPHPDRDAVLSASIAPAGAGRPAVAESLESLRTFFDSEAGRAALSRSGRADTVEVLDKTTRDGILFLDLRDESPFEGPRVAPRYWRALLDLRGHIVTLSVMAPAGEPLSRAGAMATLEAFVAVMRQRNPSDAAAG